MLIVLQVYEKSTRRPARDDDDVGRPDRRRRAAPCRSIVRNPTKSQRTRRLRGKKKKKNKIRVNTDDRQSYCVETTRARKTAQLYSECTHTGCWTRVYGNRGLRHTVYSTSGGRGSVEIGFRDVMCRTSVNKTYSHVQIIIHHLSVGDFIPSNTASCLCI